MKEQTINEIIQKALVILEKEVGLCLATISNVSSRSFKPISDFFSEREEGNYNDDLLSELNNIYQERFQTGEISRNVYNLRTRGIRILREVHNSGTFLWKGPSSKERTSVTGLYEQILSGFQKSETAIRKDRSILSIAKRFLKYLSDEGMDNISNITPEHIQAFLVDISKSRPKSMDDVVSTLRKLNRYLTNSGFNGLPYVELLIAPRARDCKILPHMPQDDLEQIITHIDRSTSIGKRDYAILLLTSSSGLRAGDIAKLVLTDINWNNKEIHIIQGKTQVGLSLPLYDDVGTALADYILNGRPVSNSPQIFLRSVAPFQGFHDGVSVACILRRRMKSLGIVHLSGDGKTMHGIRRMLGTRMTVKGVPYTTIAQILGHQDPKSARQYISLDIE